MRVEQLLDDLIELSPFASCIALQQTLFDVVPNNRPALDASTKEFLQTNDLTPLTPFSTLAGTANFIVSFDIPRLQNNFYTFLNFSAAPEFETVLSEFNSNLEALLASVADGTEANTTSIRERVAGLKADFLDVLSTDCNFELSPSQLNDVNDLFDVDVLGALIARRDCIILLRDIDNFLTEAVNGTNQPTTTAAINLLLITRNQIPFISVESNNNLQTFIVRLSLTEPGVVTEDDVIQMASYLFDELISYPQEICFSSFPPDTVQVLSDVFNVDLVADLLFLLEINANAT